MVPEEFHDLFERTTFPHVATIGPDGIPQTTPVWVELHEGKPRFSTVKGRRKQRNLAANPAIALSVLDPDDPYRYYQIRGRAVLIDDPGGSLIQTLSQKYRGRPYTQDRPDAERVIVTIEPL